MKGHVHKLIQANKSCHHCCFCPLCSLLQVMNECLEEYIRCNEQDRELDPVALQARG